ncbi:epoxyqueuosine reductase [Clostridium pascui]|uniref:epoxyqueuosine reductase n=1 Tax=Clostridium pascui TaxID=46609 RepID=UPI00195EA440|nr:4Fe-4S double cluster binding domain-containing protein [Clostridium pascui]MBM7868649.1 epoxyqueuosine reductase [Clostridium pascui]
MNLLAEQIKSAALSMGYEKCGIIKISDMLGYEEKLNERIERIPEVKPYYEGFYRFAHLQDTYSWAKSIVICVRQYGKYHIPEHLKGSIAKYYLVDSRRDENSQDYQDSLKFEAYMQKIGLKTATERKFGITALRWAALKAGLGLVRKNNFFYTESGSWVYLEAWLIDQELESVEIPRLKPCPEHCNLCIKSCPTSSLSQPYTMNRSTCISCLTTWEGWDLPHEKFNKQMGSWIFGCDICQDVCPFNKNSWTEDEEFPFLSEISQMLSLEQIIEADYEFLENVIQPKLWYIPQEKAWRYKTNALNAMLNAYKPEYLPFIEKACNDKNENVLSMAKWVLSKL